MYRCMGISIYITVCMYMQLYFWQVYHIILISPYVILSLFAFYSFILIWNITFIRYFMSFNLHSRLRNKCFDLFDLNFSLNTDKIYLIILLKCFNRNFVILSKSSLNSMLFSLHKIVSLRWLNIFQESEFFYIFFFHKKYVENIAYKIVIHMNNFVIFILISFWIKWYF